MLRRGHIAHAGRHQQHRPATADGRADHLVVHDRKQRYRRVGRTIEQIGQHLANGQDVELQRDRRHAREQSRQRRRNQPATDTGRGAAAEHGAFRQRRLRRPLHRRTHLLEGAVDLGQEARGLLRRRQPTTDPVEQPGAELILHAQDHPRHGRLRDAQLAGGAGQAAARHHCPEHLDLAEGQHAIPAGVPARKSPASTATKPPRPAGSSDHSPLLTEIGFSTLLGWTYLATSAS